MSELSRFALVGGTFDPIHRGHVEAVMSVFDRAGWTRVIFIPANVQPFKAHREITSGYHRFAMAVLATEDDPRIEVNPIELERGSMTYTVETLEALREQHRDAIFDWIIGDDNLQELSGWRSIDRIFQLANFAVLHRSEVSSLPPEMAARVRPPAEQPRNGAIMRFENTVVPVSSTEVRRRLAAGEDVRGMVHPRVEKYIERHGLYRPILAGERTAGR